MTDLLIPDAELLQQEHAGLLVDARAVLVTDAASYTVAANIGKALTARIRFVESFFQPIKQSIDAAKKTVLDREKLVLSPLKAGRARTDGLLKDYNDEQERQRQLAEKQAKEDAQLAEAVHHEALGDQMAAEAALNGQGLVNVTVPPAVPKLDGTSFPMRYSAEVTDLLALVKAVAAGQVPLAYVQANESVLNQQARALKESLVCPGVKLVKSQSVSHRA